jgi:hypothetical protein
MAADSNEVGRVEIGNVNDMRSRVEAVETIVEMICRKAGTGPGDGVMILLIAAAHISMRCTEHSGSELDDIMGAGMMAAVTQAEEWFGDEDRRLN